MEYFFRNFLEIPNKVLQQYHNDFCYKHEMYFQLLLMWKARDQTKATYAHMLYLFGKAKVDINSQNVLLNDLYEKSIEVVDDGILWRLAERLENNVKHFFLNQLKITEEQFYQCESYGNYCSRVYYLLLLIWRTKEQKVATNSKLQQLLQEGEVIVELTDIFPQDEYYESDDVRPLKSVAFRSVFEINLRAAHYSWVSNWLPWRKNEITDVGKKLAGTILERILSYVEITQSAKKQCRIVLEGPTGSGKTLAAQKLMKAWSDRKELHNVDALLYIDLNQIVSACEDFEETLFNFYLPDKRHVHHPYSRLFHMRDYLQRNQSNVMFLLDGGHGAKLVENTAVLYNRLTSTYKQASVILTMRTNERYHFRDPPKRFSVKYIPPMTEINEVIVASGMQKYRDISFESLNFTYFNTNTRHRQELLGTRVSLMESLVEIMLQEGTKTGNSLSNGEIYDMQIALGKYALGFSAYMEQGDISKEEKLLRFAVSCGLISHWNFNRQPRLRFPCKQLESYMIAFFISNQSVNNIESIVIDLSSYGHLCEPEYFPSLLCGMNARAAKVLFGYILKRTEQSLSGNVLTTCIFEYTQSHGYNIGRNNERIISMAKEKPETVYSYDINATESVAMIERISQMFRDSECEEEDMERATEKHQIYFVIERDIGFRGGVIQIAGVKMSIPPGSLKEKTRIQLSVISSNEEIMINGKDILVPTPIVRCKPSDLCFSEEVLLQIPHNVSFDEKEQTMQKHFRVLRKKDNASDWEELPSSICRLQRYYCTIAMKTFSEYCVLCDAEGSEIKLCVHAIKNKSYKKNIQVWYHHERPEVDTMFSHLPDESIYVNYCFCSSSGKSLDVSIANTDPPFEIPAEERIKRFTCKKIIKFCKGQQTFKTIANDAHFAEITFKALQEGHEEIELIVEFEEPHGSTAESILPSLKEMGPISDGLLRKIAKRMCAESSWNSFVLDMLKLEQNDIDTFYKNYPRDIEEACYRLLKYWKDQNQECATQDNLWRMMKQHKLPIDAWQMVRDYKPNN